MKEPGGGGSLVNAGTFESQSLFPESSECWISFCSVLLEGAGGQTDTCLWHLFGSPVDFGEDAARVSARDLSNYTSMFLNSCTEICKVLIAWVVNWWA